MGQRQGRLSGVAWLVIGGLGLGGLAGSAACTRREPAPAPAGASATPATEEPAPEQTPDVMPKLLTTPITYPAEARERGEQGIVQVQALVGVDGKVIKTVAMPNQKVAQVLIDAAVAAVREWTFEPAKIDDRPVKIWVVVPVNFRLQ